MIIESHFQLTQVVRAHLVEFGSNCSLNHLDVSRVKDMREIFHLTAFNGDISKWDTSSVETMAYMFAGTVYHISSFNGDISRWDVSNVKDMSAMFLHSKFNGDISKWNVSRVKKMRGLFFNSRFNGDISNWNVSHVDNMRGMFYGSQFTGDLSQWNVSRVKSMYGMFEKSKFNGDISNWDVSKVEQMGRIFHDASFSGNISFWKYHPDLKIEKPFSRFHLSPLGILAYLEDGSLLANTLDIPWSFQEAITISDGHSNLWDRAQFIWNYVYRHTSGELITPNNLESLFA